MEFGITNIDLTKKFGRTVDLPERFRRALRGAGYGINSARAFLNDDGTLTFYFSEISMETEGARVGDDFRMAFDADVSCGAALEGMFVQMKVVDFQKLCPEFDPVGLI